jgi:transcriptional regulator with XRE-family HTH domain
MHFRDALEKEIRSQGLAVAEIAEGSGLSKGAIYNILNGKTEEERIRPSTRRQIASACNRDLQLLDDGSVVFVEPGDKPDDPDGSAVQLSLIPERPFLDDSFLREPFDWIHSLEANGELLGRPTVDRVFQRRDDFLSLVVENNGLEDVSNVKFDIVVNFTDGQVGKFNCRLPGALRPGGRQEQTVFLHTGPPFSLDLVRAVYVDNDGQNLQVPGKISYVNEGRSGD